jgi:heme A synthase
VLLRLLESLHGHFGVLAAVALIHPAWLLRRGKPLSRGARWSVGLTALVTTAAFSLGLSIYESYRETVKRQLFAFSREAGWLFETKEHLAFAVISLTLGATAAAFATARQRTPEARRIRRMAAAAYAAAAILCLVVVALGTYVASLRSFPEP